MTRLAPAAIVAAALLPSCKRHAETTGDPGAPSAVRSAPPASSSGSNPIAAPPAVGSGVRLLPPARRCRALEVKGRVADEAGRAIGTSASLDRAEWLDLDAGARITVINIETSREVTFLGKGRIMPCVGGEERFYVVAGEVRTVTAAGAHPGAEVLLATPFAAVHYGDARLDATIDPRGFKVRAVVGEAWIEVPKTDGSGVTEEKIPSGARVEKKNLTVDVKALLHACELAAEVSEARAKNVLRPVPAGDQAPLGARAAEHVRARRAARFACAVAGAALGTVEKSGDREVLVQALGRAEARYLGVPSAEASAEKTEFR